VQNEFLQTYLRLCMEQGGPKWQKHHNEVVTHQVRKEIVPIMKQEGMDDQSVQALCFWAEKMVMK
jgi:hypothetical protein